MATWRDGPRYAPVERPEAFAEPAEAVSLSPQSEPPGLPSAPPEAPVAYTEERPGVPLESVTAIQTDVRDPAQPFAVAAMTMTATGDLGEEAVTGPGQSHSPFEPFHVNSASPSVSATWAPPPPDAMPAAVARPVTMADCLTAAYPPLLVLLIVMGVVALAEPFLGYLAVGVAFFLLIPRVRFMVRALRGAAVGVLVAIAVLYLVGRLLDTTMYNLDLGVNWWIGVGCWALAVVDVALQFRALRRGQSPQQTS